MGILGYFWAYFADAGAKECSCVKMNFAKRSLKGESDMVSVSSGLCMQMVTGVEMCFSDEITSSVPCQTVDWIFQ